MNRQEWFSPLIIDTFFFAGDRDHYRNQKITDVEVGCPALIDAYKMQLQHIRIRDYHRRGDKKTLSIMGPGKLL